MSICRIKGISVLTEICEASDIEYKDSPYLIPLGTWNGTCIFWEVRETWVERLTAIHYFL